ncbi:ULK3 [Mytilus edulis]|uniref:non-specific serine/threonine protein kinase n=1 Tax=Mytilus edulis TaxID=6550 RepID=A0A8S3SF26_MYTED|nr:ULK3 [Mytilus edulis]
MPLFEALSYSSDKNVVILDIGAVYTKCGLAGETGPRCIIPSVVKNEKNEKIVKIWEFSTTEELYENLKIFYFNYFSGIRTMSRPSSSRPCSARTNTGNLFPSLQGFVFTEKLGSGTYATVYKAYKKTGGRDVVAIKCVLKSGLNKASTENLLREIELLKKLKHQNIVELYDFQWDEKYSISYYGVWWEVTYPDGQDKRERY